MEQEFSSPDVIGEGGVSLSPEAIKEASEKYQERAKKTQAQLQRIKKDERWAQWDNEILFQILSKFIQDPYYASLIPAVTELLRITLPSRAIIGYIALLYPDAAYYLAHSLKKDVIMDALRGLHRYEDMTVFDEQVLHPTIREWVTIWIGMMEKFLTQTGETSILMTKKTYDHMHTLHREKIEWVVADFFIFFFRTRNLDMSRSTGQAYASFIQKNLIHVLAKYIVAYQQGANIEENLLQETSLTADDLFWLQGS